MAKTKFDTTPCWCPCCEKESTVEEIDVGIGRYEYWGATGCDVQLILVTACCEADPMRLDNHNIEMDYNDLNEWEPI